MNKVFQKRNMKRSGRDKRFLGCHVPPILYEKCILIALLEGKTVSCIIRDRLEETTHDSSLSGLCEAAIVKAQGYWDYECIDFGKETRKYHFAAFKRNLQKELKSANVPAEHIAVILKGIKI